MTEKPYIISQFDMNKFAEAPDAAYIIRTMIGLNHQQTMLYLMKLNDSQLKSSIRNASKEHQDALREIHCTVEMRLHAMQQASLIEAINPLIDGKDSSFQSIKGMLASHPQLATLRENLRKIKNKAPYCTCLKEMRDQIAFHYNTNDDAAILEECFLESKGNILENPLALKHQKIRDYANKFEWFVIAQTIENKAWEGCLLGRKTGHQKRKSSLPKGGITEEDFREWFKELVATYLKYSKSL